MPQTIKMFISNNSFEDVLQRQSNQKIFTLKHWKSKKFSMFVFSSQTCHIDIYKKKLLLKLEKSKTVLRVLLWQWFFSIWLFVCVCVCVCVYIHFKEFCLFLSGPDLFYDNNICDVASESLISENVVNYFWPRLNNLSLSVCLSVCLSVSLSLYFKSSMTFSIEFLANLKKTKPTPKPQ